MASTQGSSGETPPRGGEPGPDGSTTPAGGKPPVAGGATSAEGKPPTAAGSTATTGGTGGTGPAAGRSGNRWVWPVVAFVLGALLGGVGIAAAMSGDDDEAPVAAASPSASPSPSLAPSVGPTDLLVRVPASCLDLSDESQSAFEDVDDVAAAVRSFNASRLQELVDRFQQVRPTIEALAAECRNQSTDAVVDGTVTSPAPALTPSAS